LAEAVLDGAPDRPVPGRIVAINHKAEYTPRVALTNDERADMMFGVKVALSPEDGAVRAGLPTTVHLAPGASAAPRQLAEAR
jgi:HlyD family secretion protein